MEKKRRKTVVIPDGPGKRETLPLAVLVGEEDDELRDLAKLLGDLGYGGFARGPVFRIPWPWR
jgi:hypothetical protein